MECAEEVSWLVEIIKIVVLVLSQFLFEVSGLFEFARFERICTLGEKLMHAIVVKGKLNIGNLVGALVSVDVFVHLHQPVLYIFGQIYLKL